MRLHHFVFCLRCVSTRTQGDHAACALCIIRQDALTQHWTLSAVNALGATCDAAMQSVYERLKTLPIPYVLCVCCLLDVFTILSASWHGRSVLAVAPRPYLIFFLLVAPPPMICLKMRRLQGCSGHAMSLKLTLSPLKTRSLQQRSRLLVPWYVCCAWVFVCALCAGFFCVVK